MLIFNFINTIFTLGIVFIEKTNIINIIGFLLSILYSGENTANIGFTFGTRTKACRIRKKQL